MKRKLKLTLEYDGSAYCGWQFQTNGLSIQEVIERTLKTITKKKVSIMGSGRTDAGVHAEAQVAHFVTESKMTVGEFRMALNSLLPNDIVVKQVREASMDFHAVASAKLKTYRYTILNRDHPSALSYGRCLYVTSPLDLPAMRRARKYLVGLHDFSAFRAGNCGAKSPVRKIHKIDVRRDGDFIHFLFDGNGFLKHMIRNIMGTLVLVGRGKIPARQVKEILESRDRRKAGPTAQSQGLCLVKVFYRGEKRSGKK